MWLGRSKRKKLLFESDGSLFYEGPEAGTWLQHFQDELTLSQQTLTVQGKGVINNRISELLMTRLASLGISTSFVRRLNMREQVVRALDPFPLIVRPRNVAAGSFASRLGLPVGQDLPRSLIEFYYRPKGLPSALVSPEHIVALGWAHPMEIEEMITTSMRINDFLSGLFYGAGMRLIDLSVQFARQYISDFEESGLVVSNSLTAENFRLWDLEGASSRSIITQEAPAQGYLEIARRLGVLKDVVAEKEGERK